MKKINKLIIALFLLLSASTTYAQVNNVPVLADSLTLSGIMNQVITNYPLLKKADKELIAIDAKIGLTKTAYLPNVDFSSSYTQVGPPNKIPFGKDLIVLGFLDSNFGIKILGSPPTFVILTGPSIIKNE